MSRAGVVSTVRGIERDAGSACRYGVGRAGDGSGMRRVMGEGIDHAADPGRRPNPRRRLRLRTDALRTSGAALRLSGGNRFRRRFGNAPTVENRWANREAQDNGITNARDSDP